MINLVTIFTAGLQLNHFAAMALFAAAVSVAFGFLSRRPTLGRLSYIAWSFALFLFIAIAVGWAMYPLSR